MLSRVERSALLLGLGLFLGTGCSTRYARVPLVEEENLRMVLRAELRDGEAVDRGFHQPATIAGVRIAHLLAQIDVRMGASDGEKGERQAAIPTELVYPLGEQLSAALAKADPSQEVVVQARRSERKLGLFTQTFVTSFLAFVGSDDLLHLEFFRLDWPVPKGSQDEPSEPLAGQELMAFRVLASEGVEPVGPQAVAVDWRDERFRNPTSLHIGSGGKVTRRTVLMEEEAPAAEAESGTVQLPTDPESLRALANLEEARRNGEITEAEYQRKRRELLAPAAR